MATTPGRSPMDRANVPTSCKSQRILACVLCQQRKIKCDRKFPCAICRKTGVQCVPAALITRQRRRRFPERELLDRLRHYEDLLRQHDIPFEPLHPQAPASASNKASPSASINVVESPNDPLSEAPADKLKAETVDLWKSLNQEDQNGVEDDASDGESDDQGHFTAWRRQIRPKSVQQVWNQVGETNDHLFFGSSRANVALTALHPPSATIFRLWQIYCDNVNPLLKVTHIPTLQQRIVEASSNLQTIHPNLEALMFSIYAVAVCTLPEVECLSLFGASRKYLLIGYQFACWQALANCGVLRSMELDSLTALVLYLVSARPDVDPASLSCMLSVAVRVAQRMGIHRETTNAEQPALKAELRRRLWWALVLFDSRVCELSVSANSSFDPVSDCKTPINISDAEFRPEMKLAPEPYERPTDAIFAVVRSQMGDFIRNSTFYIQYSTPVFRAIARKPQLGALPPRGEECAALEKVIEEQYLSQCKPEIPLHFMTIWYTRCQLAKMLILEHYTVYNVSSVTQTDEQRDIAMNYSIRMLKADTLLMTSPMTQGFIWFLKFYMPALAYFHAVQDLSKRPFQKHADAIWAALDENYQAHFIDAIEIQDDNPLVKLLDGLVWQAWEARGSSAPTEIPMMVALVRDKMLQRTRDTDVTESAAKMSVQDSQPPPMPMMTDPMANHMMGALPDVFGQAMMMDMSGDPGLDWSGFDWNSMHTGGW